MAIRVRAGPPEGPSPSPWWSSSLARCCPPEGPSPSPWWSSSLARCCPPEGPSPSPWWSSSLARCCPPEGPSPSPLWSSSDWVRTTAPQGLEVKGVNCLLWTGWVCSSHSLVPQGPPGSGRREGESKGDWRQGLEAWGRGLNSHSPRLLLMHY